MSTQLDRFAGGVYGIGELHSTPTVPNNTDTDYGLLGLEAAAATSATTAIETLPGRALRRRVTQYAVKLPELAESNPLVASGSRTIYEQFKTRTMRGRKLAKPGWIAAMVPTQQAVVIQPSSYSRPVTLRRKVTRRRLLDVPDFLSNYIAPVIGAVDLDQRPFKVRYTRSIKLVPPLSLYPPPTGPPNYVRPPSAKQVSQRRRFLSSPPQSLYPATPATTTNALNIAEPFRTKVSKGRKTNRLPFVPVYTVTAGVQTSFVTPSQVNRRKSQKRGFVWSATTLGIPGTPVSVVPFDAIVPVTTNIRKPDARGFVWSAVTLGIPSGGTSAAPFDAAKEAKEIRRKETRRKLRKVATAPVYPASSAGSPVPYGAITSKRIRRSKSRGMGFVSVDAIVGQPVAGTTPASYPSHEETGYLRRMETKRRLRTAVVAPVYPYTAPSTSADRAITEPFKTRIAKGRKLQKLVLAPVFPATPIPPVVYGAVVRPKTNKRKSRSPGFVLDYTLVGAPQVPTFEATEQYGYLRRRETRRELRRVIPAPVYPATPPVAAQPPEAVRTRLAKYVRSQVRKVQGVYAPQNVDAAPPVAPDTGGSGWWPEYHSHREHARQQRERRLERERESQRIDDAAAKEIARILREQEAAEAEKAELKRLQALADKYADTPTPELPRAARLAILNAQDARSRNALQQLRRVIEQLIEEEELAVLLILLSQDD